MPHRRRPQRRCTTRLIFALAVLAFGLAAAPDVAIGAAASHVPDTAEPHGPAREAVLDVFVLTRDDPHGARYRHAVARQLDAAILPNEAFARALGPPGRITDRAAEALNDAIHWLDTQGRPIYAASLIPPPDARPDNANHNDTPRPANANANPPADFLARILLTRGRIRDWQLIDNLGAPDPPPLGPRRVSLVVEHVRQLDPAVRLWVHDTLDSQPRLERFIHRLDNLLATGATIDGLALSLAEPGLIADALARLDDRFGVPIRIVAVAQSAVDDLAALIAHDAPPALHAISLGPLWAGQRHGGTGLELWSETWQPSAAGAALGMTAPRDDD